MALMQRLAHHKASKQIQRIVRGYLAKRVRETPWLMLVVLLGVCARVCVYVCVCVWVCVCGCCGCVTHVQATMAATHVAVVVVSKLTACPSSTAREGKGGSRLEHEAVPDVCHDPTHHPWPPVAPACSPHAPRLHQCRYAHAKAAAWSEGEATGESVQLGTGECEGVVFISMSGLGCVCVCVCGCVAVWLCVVAVAVCDFGGVGVWGCDFVRAASNSARARRAYHYSPALPCFSQIRRFKEQAVPASQRIQHWWRQKLLLWAAQSELGARRHQAFVVQMSAIDIQRAARGFVARSVVKRRRRNFNFAATRIQARVRGNLQRAAYAPFKCKRLVRGAVCRVVDCGCSPAHSRLYCLARVAVHLTARRDEDPVRQPHAPCQSHRGEAPL